MVSGVVQFAFIMKYDALPKRAASDTGKTFASTGSFQYGYIYGLAQGWKPNKESPLEPQGSPGVVGRFVCALGHQRCQGEGRIFLWSLRVAHSSFVGQGREDIALPLRKENSVPDAGMEAASSVVVSESQDCISS
ncbi:hypothetical protein MG293_010936 [Ovis ammon polii]|uniref:Uncharacterized protein n=1 Tax=Ovis ammon polii TaxID=230172 RepID=A0AAD4U6H0_OVIAM|nr:hypothetical protein MG293_010936 [Ovis ammon polii]